MRLVAKSSLAALIFGAGLSFAAANDLAERGAYLVNTVMACGNCHTPMGPDGPIMDRAFSGGLSFANMGFDVTASNITPHDTGIGGWTDDDIKRALVEGRRPDGTALAPIMPYAYYKVLTETDLNAIVAYLRTITPIDNETPAPNWQGETVPPFPGAEASIPQEEQDADPTRKGFYLVTIAHCMECHTNAPGGGAIGAGGLEIPGPWGIAVTANITADPDAGLGEWTDDEIVTAITRGVSRDGRPLMPPMGYPHYAGMTKDDLAAMVAHLRTLPPAQ